MYGADVGSGFEEVGRERVSEGVGRDSLLNSCRAGSFADRALGGGFVEVVAAEVAASGIAGEVLRRKEPLPRPVAGSAGDLSV